VVERHPASVEHIGVQFHPSRCRCARLRSGIGLGYSRYHKDNRLGAVYSSLFGFWTARDAAIRASGANAQRRDSYSVVLFHHQPEIVVENDFSSTPQQLLNVLLRRDADGGTNFNGALQTSLSLMEKHWRTDQQVPPSSIALNLLTFDQDANHHLPLGWRGQL